MRIKKIAETTPITGQVIDGYSESTTDGYSCNFVNNLFSSGNNFIKFPDGTMICYGKTNPIRLTSTQMNVSVNFPQEFIDVPMVVGSLDDAGSYKTSFSTGLGITATKTSVNFGIKSLGDYSGSATVNGNYIAIGRWK